ncbi:hypothetical protein JCM10908_006583 [Rhodotorula pacifica]|uniref:uncharacterized protein n=1 Tax=Rhodotorula pacifica TaxID=1495444 RepID=UPI0031717F74
MSQDSARGQFKPMRSSRASISVMPTATTSVDSHQTSRTPAAHIAGETPATAQPNRKKRAQSLGGDALDAARKRARGIDVLRNDASANLTLELSPGKLERRRAQPRRSILKAIPAFQPDANHTIAIPPSETSARLAAWSQAHAHTTDFSGLSTSASAPTLSSLAAGTNNASATTANNNNKGRRSSLKPASGATAQTVVEDSDEDDEDEEEDPNGSLDMDMTRFETTAAYDADGRRKSVGHSRRVSFAPNAHIRTFTPDKPTAEAQAFEAAQAAAAAAEAADLSGDASFASSSQSFVADQESDEDEDAEEDIYESEPSMEIAGDEVTLAFASHFAGTQIPISALSNSLAADEDDEDAVGLEEQEEDDSISDAGGDEDGTQAMDEVTTDGITSAFAQQLAPAAVSMGPIASIEIGGFDAKAVATTTQANAQLQLFGTGSAPAAERPRGPRPSEVARNEDQEDEEVMRQLGFAKGGKPRKSRVGFAAGVIDEEDEDDEEDGDVDMEEDDETAGMDMTAAIGGIVSSPARTVASEAGDESGIDSDVEVSMQLTSGERTMDLTFAIEQDIAISSVPTAPAVVAPAPAGSAALRRPSSIFASSTNATTSAASAFFQRATSAPPTSPSKSAAERAASYVSPPKTFGRALSVLVEGASSHTPTRSPFRRISSASPGPAGRSPYRSPRRISVAPPKGANTPSRGNDEENKAPAPAPPKCPKARAASPVKFPPPSFLAAKSPAKTKQHGPAETTAPLAAITPRSRTRSRSRSRSASPAKQPSTPGRAVFQPKTLAPPLSAGRSPGGSLSLRALMEKTDPSAVQHKNGRPSTGDELNLTASSYDASFTSTSVEERIQVPESIDAFLALTGTRFADDGLLEVVSSESSAANRRKSMAAKAADAGEPADATEKGQAGPPSFADMTVAGACQALFHQLYHDEQKMLLEGIRQAHELVAQQEEEMRRGAVPQIFRDYANAGDDTKAGMKSQFGQIKLLYLLQNKCEWKKIRNQNHGAIIGFMEQNLELLQRDREVLQRLEVDTVIPSLEARHAALQSDLVAERALDRELSAMSAEDVEVRQSMLADAEEQEEQLVGNPEKGIPGRRPELDRAEQHLLSYRETFEKYSGEEARLQSEIAELEERRRDKRTRADLVRLQADYDALQHVHGWRLHRFDPRQIRMLHFDDIQVECTLQPGSLNVATVELSVSERPTKSADTPGAQVARYLLAHVSDELRAILTQEGPKDARMVLQYIGARACIIRHIRHELSITSLKYPIATRTVIRNGSHNDSILELDVDVFALQTKQGFSVVVPLSAFEVLEPAIPEDWAKGISTSVRAHFGTHLNALALSQTVNDRLEGGSGRNALVEAITAAEEEASRPL